VQYADGLVIMAMDEMVLQGMIATLSEIGSCFGLEMNVEKLRTISRQISPIQTMTDQKQPVNVEYFNYWASTETNDAKYTREIKSKIAMGKAALNKNKVFSPNKLDLNLRQKLLKCYIRSTALYGAEKSILRKLDNKFLQSFQMWHWRRMLKISWTDRVKDEVSQTVKEERHVLQTSI